VVYQLLLAMPALADLPDNPSKVICQDTSVHRPLNPNTWKLELEYSSALFDAWRTGHTGFPMVDLCIRCLLVTGPRGELYPSLLFFVLSNKRWRHSPPLLKFSREI